MRRSFFSALGLFVVLLGLEFHVVDRFEFRSKGEKGPAAALRSEAKAFEPQEWAPWVWTSAGVVVFIYSLTLAKKPAH